MCRGRSELKTDTDVFLNDDAIIAEAFHALSLGTSQHVLKILFRSHDAHALSAPAHDRLNQNGITDIIGLLL